MGHGEAERISAYDDLPATEITASQLVARNMARFRRAAKMRQADLAQRIGSTSKAVSALETSWKGDRTRQFDAGEIVALASALRVPVAAFLLPPEDDGEECRYVLTMPDGQDEMSMAELFTHIMPGPPEDDSVVTAYYWQRYSAALAAYLDPAQAHEIAGTFEELATEEQALGELDRLGQDYQALRSVLMRVSGQQDALARRIERMRRQ